MNFQEVIRLALRALSRNKMRTLLTMLGIIIGVGAVICTVAIGQGAGNQVQAQIQNLGTNLVMVFAGSVNTGGVRMGSQATKTLTDDDAQAILQHVPNITAVSPSVIARRASGQRRPELGHAYSGRLRRVSRPAQLALGRGQQFFHPGCRRCR